MSRAHKRARAGAPFEVCQHGPQSSASAAALASNDMPDPIEVLRWARMGGT